MAQEYRPMDSSLLSRSSRWSPFSVSLLPSNASSLKALHRQESKAKTTGVIQTRILVGVVSYDGARNRHRQAGGCHSDVTDGPQVRHLTGQSGRNGSYD